MTDRDQPGQNLEHQARPDGSEWPSGHRRPSETYHRVAPPSSSWISTDRALIAVFLCAITLPMLGMLLKIDTTLKLEENRELSKFPEWKLKKAALAEFPAKFESYFNDQFGFRPRLIQWLNYLKVGGLGVSPTPRVILGQKGWLFYGDVDLPYFRALEPISRAELDRWQQVFENRRNWLADRGIPYFIVFTPNKSTIYPELMPPAYNRLNNPSRLDQLMDHLKAHTNLTILDLRAPLREVKEKEQAQVFYRTDSHWNRRGAYEAYTQIIQGLATWFPDFKVVPRSQVPERTYVEPGRDLSLLLNLRGLFADTYTDLQEPKIRQARQVPLEESEKNAKGRHWTRGDDIIYENDHVQHPRAVMFRDSFCTSLIPLLADHFHRIRFSWQYTFDRQVIEAEHPHIVIQEMVERIMMDGPDWYLTH